MSEEVTDADIAAAVEAAEVAEQPAPTPEPEVARPKPKALNTFIDPVKLKNDVAINPNDLDSAMMEHASLYVHYATQTVNARRQYERLKHAFEILEARLDGDYRESLSVGGKKATEGAIRNALVADSRWSAAQARVIEAQTIWKMCEIAESALVQRKDLLLEVARDRRKEKEGQLRVLEGQSLREQVAATLSKTGAA